ncbi:MAG: hypothetical protein HOP08_15090 [Cyclobacteriaceae bacterium]|nr:hypothetical protein [Cyclobacteriaceae bacterium]
MTTAPKFYVNLWGNLQGNLTAALWPNVTKAWDEKRYQDSFNSLLDYINPALRSKYGNSSQTQFIVPHGSVVVDITITNDKVNITCPLVDIKDAMRIPLMRRIAELNFYPLTLSQIKLSSNQLTFHYSSTLDTCEPYKMYYVLKEICSTADRYDDELREKFKAKNLVEPKVIYPAADVASKAWDHVNEIIKETGEYQTYFDTQRWFGSTLDYLMLALKRIDLCLQTQGFLKTELDRVAGELANGNINVNERIQTAKTFLAGIQQKGKDAFVKQLYQADTFVPEKASISGDRVKGMIKAASAKTQEFHAGKNYIGSCIESHYCIYDLFYRNNMDNTVNIILINALTNASGKTWAEASGILLTGLQTIENYPFPAN